MTLIAALSMLLLVATDAAPAPTPTPAAVAPIDAHETGEALAKALEKTLAKADADIASEIEAGEGMNRYRIGLVIGPARLVRPRGIMGKFVDSNPPDPEQYFFGVALREPRTKRFLPGATVLLNLEYEGGGEVEVPELTGPYPLYGSNFRIPEGETLRAISVVVRPPAYHRHAEMLTAFTQEAVARFEVKATKKGKKITYAIVDPKKPAPPAADWKIGNDLRQAVGESRGLVRSGEFLLGFIAEGPEPIWLWGHPPECVAVTEKDTNHLETIVVHEPSGLMITSAGVVQRFTSGRDSLPDFLMRPLMAEFYHYGLTATVPPGKYNVRVFVDPPKLAGWGDGIASPQARMTADFEFERSGVGVAGAEASPVDEAKVFGKRLSDAVNKYNLGRREDAFKDVTDAFFDFEGSKLDLKLRAANPSAYKALEMEWIALRTRMKSGARPAEIGLSADKISRALVLYAEQLGTTEENASAASAFMQSLWILLREGAEAILVLGVLVAVLRKTKKPEALRLVYGGAGAGLAVSIVLGVALIALLGKAGAAKEGLEGVVILFAVVVLFFTSYWLISKVEGRRWALFVKHHVEEAVTSGRRISILSLAFLVVFREGAETTLMYYPLFVGPAGTLPVLGGMALATVFLTALFVAYVIFGAKLPIRPFFAISGALLYLLAFKFAGDGISELQAAGWIGATGVTWIPNAAWLRDWFGVRPTLQTSALQGLMLLAVFAGILWTMLRRPEPAMPESGGKPVAG